MMGETHFILEVSIALVPQVKKMKCYYFLAVLGLCCSTRASLKLQHLDLVICGILVPRPGMEPGPPVLGAQCLSHWTTREILCFFNL